MDGQFSDLGTGQTAHLGWSHIPLNIRNGYWSTITGNSTSYLRRMDYLWPTLSGPLTVAVPGQEINWPSQSMHQSPHSELLRHTFQEAALEAVPEGADGAERGGMVVVWDILLGIHYPCLERTASLLPSQVQRACIDIQSP